MELRRKGPQTFVAVDGRDIGRIDREVRYSPSTRKGGAYRTMYAARSGPRLSGFRGPWERTRDAALMDLLRACYENVDTGAGGHGA
jgi:hypothetical protein